MVELKNRNNAASLISLTFSITAPLQGTVPMQPGPVGTIFGLFDYPIPSTSSDQFTTVFINIYSIEDVGSLEVIDIFLAAHFSYNGNGSMRWQISGDGGNTWATISEGSFNTGVTPTQNFVHASGLWIPIIESLYNKLQLRIQGLANAGTVDFTIYNDSSLFITYRKKILF